MYRKSLTLIITDRQQSEKEIEEFKYSALEEFPVTGLMRRLSACLHERKRNGRII